MPYDPDRGFLSEEEWSAVEAVHDIFVANRLNAVGPRSIQGHLIGKLLADAERKGMNWRQFIVGQLPVTLETARGAYRLTNADERAIEYSRLHAGHYIAEMGDRAREKIRTTITRALAEKKSPAKLSQDLFNAYGDLNKDWRRIALTESNIAVSNGYLASLPEGQIVVGDSSADACEWCQQNIHGRAFKLLTEAPEPTDGIYYTQEQSWRQVWIGKTNIGRSRSARRRDGMMRTPDELWHPCIPAHPHCRCRWRRFVSAVEAIDPGTGLVRSRTNLGL